jgi:hypothetical protein
MRPKPLIPTLIAIVPPKNPELMFGGFFRAKVACESHAREQTNQVSRENLARANALRFGSALS